MKILKKSALVLLSFLILFLVGTFIFHRISLEKEQASLTPMGKTVLVNGHKINVYVEGDGPETIVVLSGAGIASPILDFKNVSDSLSKRKDARTEETVLTPKLKKFQLQYSTGSDFLRFFTVFFQIKRQES